MPDPLTHERVAEAVRRLTRIINGEGTEGIYNDDWNTLAGDAETLLSALTTRTEEVERLTKELEREKLAWSQAERAASDAAFALSGTTDRAQTAEAERDAALSRVQGLEANFQRIVDDYGSNHTSKWCREFAKAALQGPQGHE